MDVDLKVLTDKVLEGTNLDEAQTHVVFDLLIHTARFTFSKGFSSLQIETLCQILATVVQEDIRIWQRPATESFTHFQDLMLRKSADRIPSSRGIFSPVQAVSAVDFVLKTYYARYALYKHTMAKVPAPEPMQQDSMDGVEAPTQPAPLSEAILIEMLPSSGGLLGESAMQPMEHVAS